jgi:multicomponent Na+:H+ antiporter subunit D
MSLESLLLLAVALPVLGAALVALLGRWPNLREAASFAAAAGLIAVVLQMLPAALEGARPSVALFEILPGLAIAFALEPLGLVFALVASVLWLVTTLYSLGYMRANKESHQTRFYACFALALGAAMGIAFAANMLTLFIFYEVLTLATYPLVTHAGTEEARHAGRLYLGVLLTTSIGFQLLAILWTWSITGDLTFQAGGVFAQRASDGVLGVLLVLYVFGIGKAAIMPFHRWLPAAMVAPVPVSALLHAVAVVKAGVFTILKVVVYLFGVDTMAGLAGSIWLGYVAAATILIASLIALRENDLKRRLAYSTIGQLSYIVLGAGLANGSSLMGGALHIAMHGFGKITLFFCAGAIATALGKKYVSELAGIGRRMPVTMTAFAVGSFALIGLPPTGGLWSKWYLARGAIEAHNYLLLAVLIASALLSAAYFLPIVGKAFFAAPDPTEDGAGAVREAPLPCLIALGLSCAGCLALFFYPDVLYRLLEPFAALATTRPTTP